MKKKLFPDYLGDTLEEAEKEQKKKTYCGRCGSLLKKTIHLMNSGFNRLTGEQWESYKVTEICTNVTLRDKLFGHCDNGGEHTGYEGTWD